MRRYTRYNRYNPYNPYAPVVVYSARTFLLITVLRYLVALAGIAATAYWWHDLMAYGPGFLSWAWHWIASIAPAPIMHALGSAGASMGVGSTTNFNNVLGH